MHLQEALLHNLGEAGFHGLRANVQSRICQQVLQAHQRHPHHLSQASSDLTSLLRLTRHQNTAQPSPGVSRGLQGLLPLRMPVRSGHDKAG